MIHFSDSYWSLTELLKALGYTHRASTFGSRDVMRGHKVVCTGNYDGVLVWLAESGQVAWSPSIRERAERCGDDVMSEAA